MPEKGVVKTDLSIVLRNFGRGVAHHSFCNAQIASNPGALGDTL